MDTYTKQANDFAAKHNVKLRILESDYKQHFIGDKDCRWVFKCRLQRGRKQYTFNFGQSIAAGHEEPTMYDVLATVQKYDVGSFEDFCGDFGYDTDSRTAERVYHAVCKEYAAIERLFGDVIEELYEIQ